MKRVLFCAFLCILLIGTVSAVNLTPSKIPAATLKVTAAPTLQYIVKPDVQVSFSPSVTPTQIQYGSLEVYSNPSEAEVAIFDNQYQLLGNYSSPLYLPIVPLGTFNIAITYPRISILYRDDNNSKRPNDGRFRDSCSFIISNNPAGCEPDSLITDRQYPYKRTTNNPAESGATYKFQIGGFIIGHHGIALDNHNSCRSRGFC